mgnify:CR=1 FL=1
MTIKKLIETISNDKLDLASDFKCSEILKQNIQVILHNYSLITKKDSDEIQLILDELGKLKFVQLSASDLAVQLIELKRAIGKKGYIETYSSASFISTVPLNNIEKYSIIQARLTIAAICLSNLVGYSGVIEKAFQQFRSMIDNDESIISFLPDFSQPIAKLINELDILRLKNPKFALRVMPVKKIFTCYQKKEPVYRPIVREPPITLKPGGPIISTPVDSDDEPIEIIEYIQTYIDENVYHVEEVERVIDQPKIEQFYSVKNEKSKEINQSLALQNQAAKAVINNINRRQKKLSTSASHLTQREVSILIDECTENILKSEEYPYLLLSLTFGRDLTELYTERFDLIEKGLFYGVSTEIDLPKHEIKSQFSSWVRRSSKQINLKLPSIVGEGLSSPIIRHYKPAPEIYKMNDILTSINKEYKTNLTLNRIRHYFEFYLRSKGVDGSEIAFILDRGLPQEPGTYYYSVNTEKLQSIYQNYVEHLFQEPQIKNEPNNNKVGSQLQVIPSTISNLFSEISIRLNQERNRRSERVVDFHNLYVLHSILLLNLATGHRPVCDPYESLNIFDFSAKTIFISDKEERTELAARVLVLPDLAIEQLSNYLAHLNVLSIYYRNTYPEVAEQIMLSKTGGGSETTLFFFIIDDELVHVTPTTLKGYLDDVFPLPLNWHRHFMRTKLRELGFSGPFVDSWMGHIGHAGANFDRYSGLSMDDLRQISKGINGYMKEELNIESHNGMSII